jgi:hypothetical protein
MVSLNIEIKKLTLLQKMNRWLFLALALLALALVATAEDDPCDSDPKSFCDCSLPPKGTFTIVLCGIELELWLGGATVTLTELRLNYNVAPTRTGHPCTTLDAFP